MLLSPADAVRLILYMLVRICRRAESADSDRFLQTRSARSVSADEVNVSAETVQTELMFLQTRTQNGVSADSDTPSADSHAPSADEALVRLFEGVW